MPDISREYASVNAAPFIVVEVVSVLNHYGTVSFQTATGGWCCATGHQVHSLKDWCVLLWPGEFNQFALTARQLQYKVIQLHGIADFLKLQAAHFCSSSNMLCGLSSGWRNEGVDSFSPLLSSLNCQILEELRWCSHSYAFLSNPPDEQGRFRDRSGTGHGHACLSWSSGNMGHLWEMKSNTIRGGKT